MKNPNAKIYWGNGLRREKLGSFGDTFIGLVPLRILRVSLLLGRRVVLLRCCGRGANLGLTDEDGTGFDGEGAGFDVTDHFGTGFDLHTVGADDVTVHFSVNDDGLGFHLGLDVGVFGDGEGSIRADFPFDPAIDQKVVGEANGAIDVNVVAENVALSREPERLGLICWEPGVVMGSPWALWRKLEKPGVEQVRLQVIC